MPTHVVFLRAVNVRPRWVKMSRLRELLESAGFTDVQTYIQSGNVRVTSRMRSHERVKERLERLIEGEFGFQVPCLVRSIDELAAVARYAESLESPWPDSADPVRRYVTLLPGRLTEEQHALCSNWAQPGERLHGHGREIYWWLTKPTHQAKVSNARFGEGATTRDLKVIRELARRWSGSTASG